MTEKMFGVICKEWGSENGQILIEQTAIVTIGLSVVAQGPYKGEQFPSHFG